jgi:hypothetical protein
MNKNAIEECIYFLFFSKAGVGRELDEFFVYDSLVKSKSVPHELFVKVSLAYTWKLQS